MDIASARALFPGLHDRVFLDAACISLMPSVAADALRVLCTELTSCPARDASAHHIALDATAAQARQQVAKLIGADSHQIALVESTTHALQIIAAAVPLNTRDRILVGETEFLGLAVPWIGSRQETGIEIDVVPNRSGRLLAEDFATAIRPQTRMILLSSVQWSSGFRADLGAFSRLARQRDLILAVDSIQHLGAFGLDVQRTPVEFLACGGHKWLNAPAGRGFLYVRDPERWHAPNAGYLNIEEPAEGWADYFADPAIPAVRDYAFVNSARKFEIGGTANYPGNVVLAAAVKLINDLGIDNIEKHILDLTDHLIAGLDRLSIQVVSTRNHQERSGIVTFTLGRGVERDRELLRHLLDRRIMLSHRYTAGVGGLRASLHFFNNEQDVQKLIEAIAQF